MKCSRSWKLSLKHHDIELGVGHLLILSCLSYLVERGGLIWAIVHSSLVLKFNLSDFSDLSVFCSLRPPRPCVRWCQPVSALPSLAWLTPHLAQYTISSGNIEGENMANMSLLTDTDIDLLSLPMRSFSEWREGYRYRYFKMAEIRSFVWSLNDIDIPLLCMKCDSLDQDTY